jgi:hypothetical protein
LAILLPKQLRALDKETRGVLGQAINDAVEAWGHPHLHAGAGLRKLTQSYIECRSGLGLRLVFEDFGQDGLNFVFRATTTKSDVSSNPVTKYSKNVASFVQRISYNLDSHVGTGSYP